MKLRTLSIILALWTGGLASAQPAGPEIWARLPEPVTNNAVAGVELNGRSMAYSFAGLHAGKTRQDFTADAYACDLDARTCREIAGLPGGIGRVAAAAVTVRGQIYIFGGHIFAQNGVKVSTPEVWRFNPASERYTRLTDMPVPVDNSVALAFEDRYIYLVSGANGTTNVNLVQIYDVETGGWARATPFPGNAVYGHAGAMGPTGEMLICGGTAVYPARRPDEASTSGPVNDCWRGRATAASPSEIVWSYAGYVPHGPSYRAAAIALDGGFLLLGGSMGSYYYTGIDARYGPSEPGIPTRQLACCCPEQGDWFWRVIEDGVFSRTMDLRGAVATPDALFVLGGMRAGQVVSDEVLALPRTEFMAGPEACASGQ